MTFKAMVERVHATAFGVVRRHYLKHAKIPVTVYYRINYKIVILSVVWPGLRCDVLQEAHFFAERTPFGDEASFTCLSGGAA